MWKRSIGMCTSMTFFQEHIWLALTILAVGALVFVRLVAKEKHRREQYLEIRLAAKMKQLEQEENQRYSNTTPSQDQEFIAT